MKKNIFKIWIAKKKGEFTKSIKNEREISILYIRSILEQSREVWFSSLTEENALELERVQEADIRLYFGEKYENFEDGLKNHLYHICKESWIQKIYSLKSKNEKERKNFIATKILQWKGNYTAIFKVY